MKFPRHILAFRFTALGDVAMTVPVIRILLQTYPQLELTLVSEPFHAPLFENIERLHFIGASTRHEYKGLKGLWKLATRLKREVPFDAVADLHNVLRTQVLRQFIRAKNIAVIDKGRSEKRELTRPVNKKMRPLKTGFQRYADVFEKLGFPLVLEKEKGLLLPTLTYGWLPSHQSGQRVIGIAPFARHAAKMYPLEKMRDVVKLLAANPGNQVVLFGSKAEAVALSVLAGSDESVHNMAGILNFREELQAISSLQLMISMDSANMHLASLYGVPVVSVWGGTHPWLGFYGWGQDPANAVQSNLPCRPSSVFGNKPCPVHGEAGCMQDIMPEDIIKRSNEILQREQPER